MIPISDDSPVRLTPVTNWLLMALCVAAFGWEISLGSEMEGALAVLGFTPASLHHPMIPPSDFETLPPWITILTAMFLHGGVLHIAGNMLYLWIFGSHVEDAMGHGRYLVFYLISGVAASLAFAAMAPNSTVPMIGASGAISGVLAAYVLLYPRAQVRVIVPLGIIFYPLKIGAAWVVGFWFLLQLVSAFSAEADSGIAWWAHVGGFIAGGLITPLFKSAGVKLFGEVRRGPWG